MHLVYVSPGVGGRIEIYSWPYSTFNTLAQMESASDQFWSIFLPHSTLASFFLYKLLYYKPINYASNCTSDTEIKLNTQTKMELGSYIGS